MKILHGRSPRSNADLLQIEKENFGVMGGYALSPSLSRLNRIKQYRDGCCSWLLFQATVSAYCGLDTALPKTLASATRQRLQYTSINSREILKTHRRRRWETWFSSTQGYLPAPPVRASGASRWTRGRQIAF
jgi:hypothetical protein